MALVAKGALGVFGHKNPKGYSIYADPEISPLGVADGVACYNITGGGVNVNDFYDIT